MIHFEAITEDNFDAIVQMKRPPEENFVASNAYSLAQAWLYRDKGYGTQAIREIIRMAKASGKYDFMILDYVPENRRAKHVYEKLGFKPTGEIVNGGEVELKLEFEG